MTEMGQTLYWLGFVVTIWAFIAFYFIKLFSDKK